MEGYSPTDHDDAPSVMPNTRESRMHRAARSEVLRVMNDALGVVLLLELGEARSVRVVILLVGLVCGVRAVDVVHCEGEEREGQNASALREKKRDDAPYSLKNVCGWFSSSAAFMSVMNLIPSASGTELGIVA